MVSKVVYEGSLGTSSTHLKSGTIIRSDAPIDNQGKGKAFSPTDTVANALASCMFTIMGIKARDNGWNIEQSSAEVTKIMSSDPRRISGIKVHFQMQHQALEEKARKILERAAATCPVAYSIHPEIEVETTFNW